MNNRIKLLIMDVDGTLTDGKIYMSASGEAMKAFNIKDGYALSHIRDYGITPVIMTGRKSDIVQRRCEELGITNIYQGVVNKAYILRDICKSMNVSLNDVAYIGDDLNDLNCMKICGLSASPSDAIERIKENVNYVCSAKGGEGAVREFCDYIIALSNKKQKFLKILFCLRLFTR